MVENGHNRAVEGGTGVDPQEKHAGAGSIVAQQHEATASLPVEPAGSETAAPQPLGRGFRERSLMCVIEIM